MHLRHHRDRADVTCFDYKTFLRRRPVLRRLVLSVPEILRSFHRNRLKRTLDDDYGSVGTGPGRADGYVGAHGVSFLTVV
jgi:hypothetical protein